MTVWLGFFPSPLVLIRVDKIIGLMYFVGSTSVASSASMKAPVATSVLAMVEALCFYTGHPRVWALHSFCIRFNYIFGV